MRASPMIALAAAALAGPAAARGLAEPAPGDGSAGGPAAEAPSDPICTDRPTKSDVPCVVPQGVVQIEADLVNASFQRLDGTTVDTVLAPNPTLKYGLSKDLDVEASIAPFEEVRTRTAGETRTLEGVGDLYLRLKYAVFSSAGGAFQLSLVPYVKAPTARAGLGDGAVEAGVVAPMSLKLTSVLTLTLSPEVDALKDGADDGRHANTSQTVNLSLALPRDVTLYGELWADWDFDPAGTGRQTSFDLAATKLLGPSLQLDAGLNLGLDRQTPGAQAYLGVSKKW